MNETQLRFMSLNTREQQARICELIDLGWRERDITLATGLSASEIRRAVTLRALAIAERAWPKRGQA